MTTKRTPRTPSYRHHKASGRGFVEIEGRRIYLGPFREPETLQRYHQTIAEWVSHGRRLPVAPHELTVVELCLAYFEYARSYYILPDATVSSELSNVKRAVKWLNDIYGHLLAKEFGPLQLKIIREKLVKDDLSRGTVNRTINGIRRIFKWAIAEGWLSADVLAALQAVEGLRKGRSEARETLPVEPVPPAHVEAVRPLVSRQVRALIELQLLTGARGGELLRLRSLDFDTQRDVWTVALTAHKTSYRNKARVLYFGPRAQVILRAFMEGRAIDAYLFSPREAVEDLQAERHEIRVTPLSCGNSRGTNRVGHPKREAGEFYTHGSYRRAIVRACRKANVPTWTPHRLRHSVGSNLRKRFGLEAAQVLLGHARADVTQVYAQTNEEKAIAVVREIG